MQKVARISQPPSTQSELLGLGETSGCLWQCKWQSWEWPASGQMPSSGRITKWLRNDREKSEKNEVPTWVPGIISPHLGSKIFKWTVRQISSQLGGSHPSTINFPTHNGYPTYDPSSWARFLNSQKAKNRYVIIIIISSSSSSSNSSSDTPSPSFTPSLHSWKSGRK
jgi:hypothetical protein